MSYSDLGINTDKFDETDWNPPVGKTSYIEFGSENWLDAPTQVKGVDQYDRPFVVTEPVFWIRGKSEGFTPLVIWLRYTPHQEEDYNPLMVSKPGGKSGHHIIPEEQVGEFNRFIQRNMSFFMLKDDGLKIQYRADQPVGYSREMKGEKIKIDGNDDFMQHGKTLEDLE